jgi:predicted naringenin-chalcone synthase
MPSYVARPHIVLADHKVTTDEILDDITVRHLAHPRLRVIQRVVRNCGVRTRYFTRPVTAPTVAGSAGVGERARAGFVDALAMAERAALAALDAAGLAAREVDGIITSHSTGWAVPNLDAHWSTGSGCDRPCGAFR